MSDSLAINGAELLLGIFLFIILFSVLGGPVDDVMDGILGLDGSSYSDEIDEYVPYFKTAVRIAFALGITGPAIWFIAKIFSREPAHYYQQNNRNNRGGGTF